MLGTLRVKSIFEKNKQKKGTQGDNTSTCIGISSKFNTASP